MHCDLPHSTLNILREYCVLPPPSDVVPVSAVLVVQDLVPGDLHHLRVDLLYGGRSCEGWVVSSRPVTPLVRGREETGENEQERHRSHDSVSGGLIIIKKISVDTYFQC